MPSYIQSMKKAAYGITSKIELKRWTSHSIREGHCVLLSEGGHDGPFIKIYLHWKSETFFLCLCNIACMDAQQSSIMS